MQITFKTIKQILDDGSRFLSERGNENARSEAERLIAFCLRMERAHLYLNFNKPLTEKEVDRLRSLFMARAAGRPLQYIIGETSFRYLNLKVDENVLIPRPETEIIIDLVFNKGNKDSKILELGTGSGAIAISIAKEIGANVHATDYYDNAIEVAKTNALINDVDNISWLKSSWFDEVSGKYDIIVSNPPYVSLAEFEELAVEIKAHEPEQAVTDGADGLRCLSKIIDGAHQHLVSGGHLILEIGYNQKEAVKSLLENAGFADIYFEKDLAKKDRFALARFFDGNENP